MSQISLTLLRLGYLVLLWALVLSAIAVLRSDLYGTRITIRGKGRAARRGAPGRPDRAEKLAAPARSSTGVKGGTMSPREPTAARLAVTSGPLKGTVIPLGTAPITIGRAGSCTLVIEDDYASARHCWIYPENEQWFVEDLGSTNGTFLGNQRVADPVPFRLGERIRIGATTIELRE